MPADSTAARSAKHTPGPREAWSSRGGSLVFNAGSSDGRTVARLWHDEVRPVTTPDGTRQGKFASNEECQPWHDDWKQKCDDLDFVVHACNAHGVMLATHQANAEHLQFLVDNIAANEPLSEEMFALIEECLEQTRAAIAKAEGRS